MPILQLLRQKSFFCLVEGRVVVSLSQKLEIKNICVYVCEGRGLGAQAKPPLAVELALMFYSTFMWSLRNLVIPNPRNFLVGII